MAVTRLSGGLTPGNGADPRTFPAIWNGTADDLEAGDYSKVPTGGAAGEVLAKVSATDYDSEWVNIDSGRILQTVQTVLSSDVSASVAAGASLEIMTATITPQKASSGLLILASVSLGKASVAQSTWVTLVRDATEIFLGDTAGSRLRVSVSGGIGGSETIMTTPLTFVDSPNSTSPITYRINIGHTRSASDTVFVNRTQSADDQTNRIRAASSLIILEVAA